MAPGGAYEEITYDVVGPICESGDTFTKSRDLPEMSAGDLLVMHSAGAYGASLSSQYGYVRRAQASLYWERYAPVFALAAAIFSVFLIGAFSGIWERIGDPWRLIVLTIAIVFLIKAALSVRHKKRPNKSEARRRVE